MKYGKGISGLMALIIIASIFSFSFDVESQDGELVDAFVLRRTATGCEISKNQASISGWEEFLGQNGVADVLKIEEGSILLNNKYNTFLFREQAMDQLVKQENIDIVAKACGIENPQRFKEIIGSINKESFLGDSGAFVTFDKQGEFSNINGLKLAKGLKNFKIGKVNIGNFGENSVLESFDGTKLETDLSKGTFSSIGDKTFFSEISQGKLDVALEKGNLIKLNTDKGLFKIGNEKFKLNSFEALQKSDGKILDLGFTNIDEKALGFNLNGFDVGVPQKHTMSAGFSKTGENIFERAIFTNDLGSKGAGVKFGKVDNVILDDKAIFRITNDERAGLFKLTGRGGVEYKDAFSNVKEFDLGLRLNEYDPAKTTISVTRDGNTFLSAGETRMNINGKDWVYSGVGDESARFTGANDLGGTTGKAFRINPVEDNKFEIFSRQMDKGTISLEDNKYIFGDNKIDKIPKGKIDDVRTVATLDNNGKAIDAVQFKDDKWVHLKGSELGKVAGDASVLASRNSANVWGGVFSFVLIGGGIAAIAALSDSDDEDKEEDKNSKGRVYR